jgi:hypothetical protein
MNSTFATDPLGTALVLRDPKCSNRMQYEASLYAWLEFHLDNQGHRLLGISKMWSRK